MVIFYSYVSLPEGKPKRIEFLDATRLIIDNDTSSIFLLVRFT